MKNKEDSDHLNSFQGGPFRGEGIAKVDMEFEVEDI